MMLRLAMSWVLVPPAVLLLRADSRLCVCAGVLLGATFALAATDSREPSGEGVVTQDGLVAFRSFGAEMSSTLPPWTVLLLSVLLYATVYVLVRRWLVTAMLLGGVSAAMAGFRWSGLNEKSPAARVSLTHEARRLAAIALASILVTSSLLMPERVRQAQAEDWSAVRAMLKALKGPAPEAGMHAHRGGVRAEMAGVPKVFLWSKPPQRTRVLMAPSVADKARVIHRSVVIPFDGPYIYTEAVAMGKTKPLVAKGSPLKVKVTSVDGNAISMEGQQRLATPVDLASCGAIEVTVREGSPATVVGLGLILADSEKRGGPRLRLATRPLQADGSGGFFGAGRTVRFPLPSGERLKEFDEMEVLVVREARTAARGARMEIESFTLLPR